MAVFACHLSFKFAPGLTYLRCFAIALWPGSYLQGPDAADNGTVAALWPGPWLPRPQSYYLSRQPGLTLGPIPHSPGLHLIFNGD
eukprot:scaffold95764_cov32-Prasinocladus_malaysianus.AAC.3